MSVGSTHSAKPPFRHHGRHEACAQRISSASSLHGDATGGLWPRAETGAHEVTDPQPYSPCTTDSWMQPAACFCHSCRGGGRRQHGRLQWAEAGEGLEEEGGRESSATPFVPQPPCSVRTGTPPPPPAVLVFPPPPSSAPPPYLPRSSSPPFSRCLCYYAHHFHHRYRLRSLRNPCHRRSGSHAASRALINRYGKRLVGRKGEGGGVWVGGGEDGEEVGSAR